MNELYGFGYTIDETLKTMKDTIDTGNHDRMFLDTYYWLEMLKDYMQIGTVKKCQEAVEKQKPKKPDYEEMDMTIAETSSMTHGFALVVVNGTKWTMMIINTVQSADKR